MTSQTHIEGRVGGTSLASFYASIYGWMALGMFVSAFTAYATLSTNLGINALGFFASLGIILPIAFVALAYGIQMIATRVPAEITRALFLGFAALTGVLLSSIAVIYTGQSLAIAFTATSVMFVGLATYGRTTGKDLSGWGPALMFGFVAAIVAAIANYIIGNGAFGMFLSAIFVVLYAASIAYSNQQYKALYNASANDEKTLKQYAVLGAIGMFISFVGMLQNLLHLFGATNE